MDTAATVIIVDGHAGVREALACRLRRLLGRGSVTAVGEVDAAVQLIEERMPDLVLYDPRTVAGEPDPIVRRLGQSGCAVMILTSSLRRGEADQLRAAGAAGVLLKGEEGCALRAALAALTDAAPRQQRSLT